MAQVILWHLAISHFSEKARWALDYKSVEHERRAQLPGMHIPVALWLTRGRQYTLPVLELDGKRIGDSTAIIAALEERFPEPPLYPADPDERRRALELEDHFDEELGPHIRRYLFHTALEEADAGEFIDGAMGSSPRAVKAAMRATAPVGRRLLRLRYGITAEE